MRRERKRIHKEVVKYMRMRNKQMAADEYVGLNRFRIDLFEEDYIRYPDGSGGHLFLVFKMTDKLTGNTAYFGTNSYSYTHVMFDYLNDFLVRCSAGHSAHWPHLHYWAYDVHECIEYEGIRKKDDFKHKDPEEGVIDKYDWTRWDLYGMKG